jgi:spermidine synthase
MDDRAPGAASAGFTRAAPALAFVGSGCLLVLELVARESNYYCIKVGPGTITTTNADGKRVEYTAPIQSLYLDQLLHSIVDLRDPTQLLYSYEERYSKVVEALHRPGSKLDSFFIGGGGYTFPRWVQATYRGHITVAEIDPEVTRVAERYLGLRRSPRLELVARGARSTLRDLPAGTTYDAIFGDAFDDYEVPYQLTTREFAELVARHLRPGGVYVLNVVDGVHYDFLRSELRTLRLVFPYVSVIATTGAWPPLGPRDTFVVAALKERPKTKLPLVSEASVSRFVADGHSVVLTDDYVPVDQLLAPVFSQAMGG